MGQLRSDLWALCEEIHNFIGLHYNNRIKIIHDFLEHSLVAFYELNQSMYSPSASNLKDELDLGGIYRVVKNT